MAWHHLVAMLGIGWQRGKATVKKVDLHNSTWGEDFRSDVPLSEQGHSYWIYGVEIQPDGAAAAFPITFVDHFRNPERFHAPLVGEQIPVKFNPKSRDVRFDESVLREMAKATKAAKKAERSSSGAP
jgi:hypothetical protein